MRAKYWYVMVTSSDVLSKNVWEADKKHPYHPILSHAGPAERFSNLVGGGGRLKYLRSGRGGRATSKVGGGGTNKKGHFLEKKGHLHWEISKRKSYHFLDIGIYPYIVITLPGMISLFVSLHTSYKISLKHHTVQLGGMSEYALTSERSEREKF